MARNTNADILVANFRNLPDEALVDMRTCMALIGVSYPLLNKLIKAGKFPKPYNLGTRLCRWRVADIRKWAAAPIEGK